MVIKQGTRDDSRADALMKLAHVEGELRICASHVGRSAGGGCMQLVERRRTKLIVEKINPA